MDVVGTILEILKYVIPSLVVLLATTAIVKQFINGENRRKQLEIFRDGQDITMRLRLQAYERMALFVERISSRQLIPRVYDSSMTVRDLQIVMIMNIRTEYEHNMSQQIYVSTNVWETVKGIKEQEMNMINRIAQTLNPEAPGRELHVQILDVIGKADGDLPTDSALAIIHTEVRAVMQQGSY